jgi:hypothetical protein
MKLACIPSPYSQTLAEFCVDNHHLLFVYHDSVFVCVGGKDATEDGTHYVVKELARIFHKRAQTSCKSLIEWYV